MLEDWFNLFWQTYPSDLALRKKGSKSECLKAIKKLNPDEQLQQKILTNLREIVRHCREEQNLTGKTDRWPFAVTWIRQERWCCIEDLGSTHDMREKHGEKRCKCGAKIEICGQCNECYESSHPDPWKAEREAEAKRRGLARSDVERIKNGCLRAFLRQTGILVKPES